MKNFTRLRIAYGDFEASCRTDQFLQVQKNQGRYF